MKNFLEVPLDTLAEDELLDALQKATDDRLISPPAHLQSITSLRIGAKSPVTPYALKSISEQADIRHLEAAGRLGLAEMLDRLGSSPRNQDLADAMSFGTPEALLEEALRKQNGPAAAATLLLSLIHISEPTRPY